MLTLAREGEKVYANTDKNQDYKWTKSEVNAGNTFALFIGSFLINCEVTVFFEP